MMFPKLGLNNQKSQEQPLTVAPKEAFAIDKSTK
jgi:hypothetical protein